MTKLYKLTNANGCTMNDTQWGEGVSHSGTGEGPLCGPGWIHAYTHPLLAVLLNPIHADIANPRLWEAEGEVGLDDHGLKVGCRTLTTVREIPLPIVTTEQRVRFAILCVKSLPELPAEWLRWADDWLSEKDRSVEAADAAWGVAAAEGVWGAADAARSWMAARSWAAEAARASAWSADAAAGWTSAPLDLISLAEQALQQE